MTRLMNKIDHAKRNHTPLMGAKVCLRAPTRSDAQEFTALNRASVKLHRGLASPPIDAEQFDAFLKRSRQAESACLLICLVGDAAIAGAINLSQIFMGGFRNAYLGYYMGAPYAGRGYMTEALELMLRYAFGDLDLHRLEANIQPQNVASIALVKRAGFVREGYSRRYLKVCGRWRDHERWAMIAEDWRAARKRR